MQFFVGGEKGKRKGKWSKHDFGENRMELLVIGPLLRENDMKRWREKRHQILAQIQIDFGFQVLIGPIKWPYTALTMCHSNWIKLMLCALPNRQLSLTLNLA